MEEVYKFITRQTYDQVAKAYAKRDQEIIPEAPDVLHALEKTLALLAGGAKILDIGCGAGRDARYFFERGFSVSGIDISPKMIDEARRLNASIDWKVMDFEYLDFADGELDAVWANASLHHVPKVRLPSVLAGIYKVLKPKGILFIKVKHGKEEGVRENEKFGRRIKRYYAFYGVEELSRLLEQADFHILSVGISTGGEWVDLFARK